jgi:hypothetical protein
MVRVEMGIDLDGEEPGEVSKYIVGFAYREKSAVEQCLVVCVICCACGRLRPVAWNDVDTRRCCSRRGLISASKSTEA